MLQKENIQLRSPELEDVDFLYQLENNHQLWHLSNTLSPFSHFDIEQYILQSEKDAFVSKQARFMIDKTDTGDAVTVGAIDLFDIEAKHRRAGIGIMIVEQERRNGFASIALDILIGYAFDILGLHQLYCNIESDNNESVQLFESKGFVNFGKKQDWNLRSGKWMDEFFFQLINRNNP